MAELEESARVINAKNYREYYHDALLEREELQSLFELGYLSLEARARAEGTFRDVARKALEFAGADGSLSGEFEILERAFRKGYVANFSVFRSVPDTWSGWKDRTVRPSQDDEGAIGASFEVTERAVRSCHLPSRRLPGSLGEQSQSLW
jgi:arginine decarboxylase-like protein